MIWLGYYGFVMIIAALNSKMLGATIVCAIGLSLVYPDANLASGFIVLILITNVLASTRD